MRVPDVDVDDGRREGARDFDAVDARAVRDLVALIALQSVGIKNEKAARAPRDV